MPTRGPTLRRERRAAEVTATALANHLGMSRMTLWTIEKAAEVDPERAAAYLAGVKALSDAKGNAA